MQIIEICPQTQLPCVRVNIEKYAWRCNLIKSICALLGSVQYIIKSTYIRECSASLNLAIVQRNANGMRTLIPIVWCCTHYNCGVYFSECKQTALLFLSLQTFLFMFTKQTRCCYRRAASHGRSREFGLVLHISTTTTEMGQPTYRFGALHVVI